MLSDAERQAIEVELGHYAQKQAGCIEALKVVQRHRGWVSDDSLRELAALLEMAPDELDGVATFYNLIFRCPVGQHVILLCDSISCWIMGYEHLHEYLRTHYGITLGETTADGQFTLLPIPCLGMCDHAPVLMVDDETYSDAQPEQLERVLAQHSQRNKGHGTTTDPEHPAR